MHDSYTKGAVKTTREWLKKHSGRRGTPLTALCLFALDDGFVIAKSLPLYRQVILHKRWAWLTPSRRRTLARALRERLPMLKYRALVQERRIGRRLILELTDRGRSRVTRELMRVAPVFSDGRQVRVEYDFPETQHKARDVFRRFLKSIGFVKFQQSIWVYGRDVYVPLCTFISERELGDWVDVIVGKPASIPRRRHFV